MSSPDHAFRDEVKSLRRDLCLQKRKMQARERNAWVRGLATGLVAAIDLAQGDQAVEHAMREAKLTIAGLRKAGVFGTDLQKIETVLKKRKMYRKIEATLGEKA